MIDMASSAVNPLRAGMRTARTVEPATMVIFGATGDLTHRKLLPALYDLAVEQPGHFRREEHGFSKRVE